MIDVRKELADLICYAGAVLNPNKWLSEEASDLATRIPHLDEIPHQAILPLAKLVANGPSDARTLSLALDIEQDKLDDYLGALCEFQFAEWTGSVYEASPAGVQAVDAVGPRMVDRELFELRRRVEEVELMRRHINGS